MIESSRYVHAWRETIKQEIIRGFDSQAWTWEEADGPLEVNIEFAFKVPQRNRVHYKTSRPDLDKLIRAVLDAGTAAGLWSDDSRVVKIVATKAFAIEDFCTLAVAAVRENA